MKEKSLLINTYFNNNTVIYYVELEPKQCWLRWRRCSMCRACDTWNNSNEKKKWTRRLERQPDRAQHCTRTSIRCNIILKYYENGCKLFRSRIILILAPKSEEKNVYDLYTLRFFFPSQLRIFFPTVLMHRNLSKAIWNEHFSLFCYKWRRERNEHDFSVRLGEW